MEVTDKLKEHGRRARYLASRVVDVDVVTRLTDLAAELEKRAIDLEKAAYHPATKAETARQVTAEVEAAADRLAARRKSRDYEDPAKIAEKNRRA